MVKVLFQKREYSEKAARYFPSNPYPFKTKFRCSLTSTDITYERLREIALSVCESHRINSRGEWQVLFYNRGGVSTINIGWL